MTRNRVMTIGLLLIVPLFVTGCGLKKNPKVTPSPSPSASATETVITDEAGSMAVSGNPTALAMDPTSVDALLQEQRKQADAKAKAWRADAQLVHVSVKLPSDLWVDHSTNTYTYGSSGDAYNWWTVTISSKTNKIVRALIPKEDFLGTGYTAIPTQHWKINYVEALQLAEVHGGSEERAKLGEPEVVVMLAIGQPKNYLWWTVEYRKSANEFYRILVNPSTKEVVNEQGQPLTGAVAESTQTTTEASPAATTTTQSTPKTTPSDVISEDDVLEE